MTDALRLIDHPLVATLGWTLTHFLWQGAVLGLIAFFLLRVVRPSHASTRYVIGVVTLGAMLSAPVATFVATAGHTASSQVAWREAPLPTVAGAGAVTGSIIADFSENPAAVRQLLPPGSREAAVDPAPLAPVWLPIVTAVWMLGVTLLSLRMVGGLMLTQWLARRAVRAVSDEVIAAARDVARRLRLSRRFEVLESGLVSVPTLVGYLRPVVLLPAAVLSGLSETQLRAIIAHELAHIRRHDYLVNLLQSAVETLLFYHPAVWWVSSDVRAEREHCCDDLAVDACGDRLVYVSALAELTSIERRAFALAATDGSLVTRVRRILGRQTDTHRELPPSWGILVLLIVVGGGAGTYEMTVDAANVQQLAQAAQNGGEVVRTQLPATETSTPKPGANSPFVDQTMPTADQSPRPAAPRASSAIYLEEWPPVPPVPPVPAVPPVPPVPPVAAIPSVSAAGAVPPVPQVPPVAAVSPVPPVPPVPPVAPVGAFAAGQRSEGNFTWSNDGERLTVKWTGPFRLAEDERDIAWVEEGARVTIADGWVFTDRIELRGLAGGQIERKFYRSGVERPFDADGQAFLLNSLQRMIRSGMFASERVARFLKRGGPDAVLTEIERLNTSSSYVKRVYYSELLKQADVSSSQLTRILQRVATDITSDHEKATLLTQVLRESGVTDDQRVLAIRAAGGINSDYEQRRVLTSALTAGATVAPALATALIDVTPSIASAHERSQVLLALARAGGVTTQTSAPFMAAVSSMTSSHEQRQVLAAIATSPGVPAVVGSDALKAAERISSSHEKSQILMQLIANGTVTDQTAPTFFAAVTSINSGHEKSQVLNALIDRGRLSDTMLTGVLRAAQTISSGHERSVLLLRVLKNHAISGPTRTLFLEVAEGISSAHEQNQVLAALVRAERR